MAKSKLKSSIMKSLESLHESHKSTAETVKNTAELVKSLTQRVKALEEEMAENEAPEPSEDVVVEEEKSKEEARSDIEGSEDAAQPADPSPEDNNDKDVYKSMAARLERIEKAVSGRSNTPRTGASQDTNKADRLNPVDMITGGKKVSMSEVHKAARNAWR